MDPKISQVGAVSSAQGSVGQANLEVIRLTSSSPTNSHIIDTEPIELLELRKLVLPHLPAALLQKIGGQSPTINKNNVLAYSPMPQIQGCSIVSRKLLEDKGVADKFTLLENELNLAGDHVYLVHKDPSGSVVIGDPTYVQFVDESKIDGLPSIMLIEANTEKQLVEGLEMHNVNGEKFAAWSSVLPREKCSLWNFSIDKELGGKSLLTKEAINLQSLLSALSTEQAKTVYMARKIISNIFVDERSEKMEMLLGEKEFPKETADYIKTNFNLNPEEAKAIVKDAHTILIDNHYGFEVEQLLR